MNIFSIYSKSRLFINQPLSVREWVTWQEMYFYEEKNNLTFIHLSFIHLSFILDKYFIYDIYIFILMSVYVGCIPWISLSLIDVIYIYTIPENIQTQATCMLKHVTNRRKGIKWVENQDKWLSFPFGLVF